MSDQAKAVGSHLKRRVSRHQRRQQLSTGEVHLPGSGSGHPARGRILSTSGTAGVDFTYGGHLPASDAWHHVQDTRQSARRPLAWVPS